MSYENKYCFLINNASNANKAGGFVQAHEEQILAFFPEAELIYIAEDDLISEIARQKSNSCTHVIACGGDGTVNQVVNGIIDKDIILGVIPLGSGNDFAKSIGLSKNFEESLHVLKREEIIPIDVVKSDWGCFINTCGIGLDGLTNLYASQSPFSHGLLRYFWGGLKALFKAQPFGIKIKTTELEKPLHYLCWMVTIANGKNEGGRYTVSPSSCNHDGKLEIIVVKDITRLRLFFEFIKISVGLPFNEKIMDVFVTKKGCKTESNFSVKSHADGEQVNTGKVNNFKLLTAAINVIVNL